MAQDASKSDFSEALEASWERLGRPKREPSWSKIEAGRVFFWSWKGKSIPSCFWMHFWSFWEPLGEAKTSISHWRGCKNQVFRKLRFNIVLRPVLEGFWRPSWSQVGLYKGSKSHLKVTSKLSWFFIEFIEFWTPQEGPQRYGQRTLWPHGKIAFWYQKCNISIGFLRFCKIVPVCPQWRSHLKVTFFIIIITTVWFKCIFICICGEGLFTSSSTRRRWHKLKI